MKTETINIKKVWKIFNFPYNKPEELNDQEALFISVKNQSYNEDWSLPEYVNGWLYAETWFNNMVAGQSGRRGATRLQWRPDMGKPIYLDGYNNDNNGASLWFIPKVDIGGNSLWTIRAETKFDQGLPAIVQLFAETKR